MIEPAPTGAVLQSVRAFVAVRLDEVTRAALGSQIERLRAAAPRVAWVSGENLHLTLKFLGNVESALLAEAMEALESAARGQGPFEIALSGVGAFPAPARARVVWAGVSAGREEIGKLAERIEVALEPVGFPRESRPFSPHVTLGRVREPRKDPRLARALEADAAREFGVVRVDAVRLMRSDPSPRGSRYSEIHVVSLSGH